MLEKLTPLSVIMARPRGFCAGVVRAVDIVERALEMFGAPVYVRHHIVHNETVVAWLVEKGAVFVDEVDQVPPGAVTIFSAHGVARSVEAAARERDLDVIDATCPLVRRVHKEGSRYAALGYDIVLVGHQGHAEVEGTVGQVDGRLHVIGSVEDVQSLVVVDPERVAYITQTTLSVIDTREIIAALRRRFPSITGPDTRDICYATQNRQKAVLALSGLVDGLIVVGSRNSSNTMRLCELGAREGIPSRLVSQVSEIDEGWLRGIGVLGITAGASAPERLVEEVVAHISSLRSVTVEVLDGVDENVFFRLPERLASPTRARSGLDERERLAAFR
ncbi:MAG: 4-hydroxy-3-methylbut-2-enyl diphosphate reductase [Hyphomicrobiaceae bacterium]|nr:4-hydroxy-3-methylbut-2-enyl diphosphate reductase [Hyphomicrobiaceae bacterium]